MQRKIKFRAWDTKNKKWLDAVPKLEYLLDDPDEGVSHHDIDEEAGLYFYPHNPLGNTFGGRVVYQQYTNLKDKNGTEIWEGDLVKWVIQPLGLRYDYEFEEWEAKGRPMEDYICEVRYHLRYVEPFIMNPFTPFDNNMCEIVGNIFENPELCKEK